MNSLVKKYWEKNGLRLIAILLICFMSGGDTFALGHLPYSNIVFSSLAMDPDPFVPKKTQMTVNYFIDTVYHALDLDVKITDLSKTKTIFNKTTKGLNFTGDNYFLWNGKDNSDVEVPVGKYIMMLTLSNEGFKYKTLERGFEVAAPKPPAEAKPAEGADAKEGATPAVPKLLPAEDILSCNSASTIMYYINDVPTENPIINCALKKSATMWAGIYTKTFDPKVEDNSANEVRIILKDIERERGGFAISWNGNDNNDQPVVAGDYVLLVGAKTDEEHKADISIQKFKVLASPPAATIETNVVVPGQAQNVINVGDKNIVDLKNAAEEKNTNTAEALVTPTQTTTQAVENVTRSEAVKIIISALKKSEHKGCYTNDCGSPFKDLTNEQGPWIRAAWDLKFASEIEKGKFYPNRNLSRAEAAAMIVKAFGLKPFQGCYTANCGAGYPDNFFLDITQNWEGPYLRTLWDREVISTLEKNKFFPEQAISRADFMKAVMMIAPK